MKLANAVSKMSVGYLVPAAALAYLFCMRRRIYDLVSASGNESKPKKRRKFFDSLYPILILIGFFLFWALRRLQSGGQPVQLYYMSKDGNRGSDSTVVAYDSCCCL